MLTRESVVAEPCKCVRCSFCRGSGRDPYAEIGMGEQSCEECGGSGISEVCGRCELLADWDREAPYDWDGQRSELIERLMEDALEVAMRTPGVPHIQAIAKAEGGS